MTRALSLQDARNIWSKCRAPPGRRVAHDALNTCRKKLQEVGQQVHVNDEIPDFHWRAYLGGHDHADDIFGSQGITDFFAEAFPEKDPNKKKLANLGLITLRVDFVAVRQDSAAVRLHPSERKEAAIVARSLEGWRLGHSPVHVLDEDAVKAARLKATLLQEPQVPERPAAPLPVTLCPASAPTSEAWRPPPLLGPLPCSRSSVSHEPGVRVQQHIGCGNSGLPAIQEGKSYQEEFAAPLAVPSPPAGPPAVWVPPPPPGPPPCLLSSSSQELGACGSKSTGEGNVDPLPMFRQHEHARMEELLPDNSASLVATYSGAGQMCRAHEHFDPVPYNSDQEGTGDVDIYIEIRKGDLVMLFREDDSGWAHGSVRGEVGWFPRKFVDVCEDTSCDASIDSMSNISAESQSVRGLPARCASPPPGCGSRGQGVTMASGAALEAWAVVTLTINQEGKR